MDPLDIGPEGAQRARERAEKSNNAIVRLRIAALALVFGAGLVLIQTNAAIHALWVLPTIPLFFSADFRLGGVAESYRSAAAQHESGILEIATVDEILRSGYRNEFYCVLAVAVLAVAVRG